MVFSISHSVERHRSHRLASACFVVTERSFHSVAAESNRCHLVWLPVVCSRRRRFQSMPPFRIVRWRAREIFFFRSGAPLYLRYGEAVIFKIAARCRILIDCIRRRKVFSVPTKKNGVSGPSRPILPSMPRLVASPASVPLHPAWRRPAALSPSRLATRLSFKAIAVD